MPTAYCRIGAFLSLLLLSVATSVVFAEDVPDSAAAEREMLARVLHELDALELLVRQADQRSVEGARVSFDYSQLRAELAAVRAGIREYISGTRLQPRSFAPLRADYTQVKTQTDEGAAQ